MRRSRVQIPPAAFLTRIFVEPFERPKDLFISVEKSSLSLGHRPVPTSPFPSLRCSRGKFEIEALVAGGPGDS